MKIRIANVLIVLLVLASCSNQDRIVKLGEEGVVLFDSGDIMGAMLKFDSIIKIDGSVAEAHLRKADCLDLLGDYEGSIASYTRAIKYEPKYKIAYYNRALTFDKIGSTRKAILDYQSAIQSDLQNEDELNNKLIYVNLGILYGEESQLDSAIGAFTKAIEIDENYADAIANRGYAYQLKGNLIAAKLDFDKASQLRERAD